jgi:2,4-dienoyl-CoA reductase-like NADH-dependent reductase (Old Yellow Enzyme family)/small ligand-binding sensory domain FIST
MLQFFSASSSIVNSRRAINECLEMALEGESNLDCDLLILYTGMGHNFHDLLNEAHTLLPNAQVVGCTCAGVIGKEGPDESLRALGIMAVKGPSDEFAVGAVESLVGKQPEQTFEAYAAAALELKTRLPGINMLLAHPSVLVYPFLLIPAIESVFGKDVPVVGGVSSDNMKSISDFQFIGEQIIEKGAVLIGFADPTLELVSQGNHGAEVIGDPFEVTDAGDFLIHSLNKLPPWKTWNESLGLTGNSAEAIFLSPLASVLPEELHEEYGSAYIPIGAAPLSPEGVILYNNRNVRQGTKVWLTRRTEEKVNEGVDWMMVRILERLDGRRPVAVFHADCVARGKFFGNRVIKDEIVHRLQYPLARGEALPWLGMYGGGELTPMSGSNELQIFTSSLYVLARRRPEIKKKKSPSVKEEIDVSPLFQGSTLGHLSLKNRCICSATWMGMANSDGSCAPLLIACASRIARNEIGMIITEMAYVVRNGMSANNQMGVDHDDLIPGLSLMAKEIHRTGTPVVMQLNHGGLLSVPVLSGTDELIGPSELLKGENKVGRAMKVEEIHEMVRAFRNAAARARTAGFDGVQVHAAHGWLLSQFLSPFYNRRKDEYGGSLENRTRILIETVRGIREDHGPDFLLMVKINSEDFLEGGFNSKEMVLVSKMLENAGVDAIEVSGGTMAAMYAGDYDNSYSPVTKAPVYYREAAETLKKELNIPVILVGGIRSFESAEALVKNGIADYISFCRPLIREPDLIKRWKSGDLRDSECVSDDACMQPGMEGKGVQCIHVKN